MNQYTEGNGYAQHTEPTAGMSNDKYLKVASSLSGGGEESDESQAAGVASMAMASGGNPYIMAAMVGLKAMSAEKKRKAKIDADRHRAQISTSNRMQSALSQLSGIGRSLKL